MVWSCEWFELLVRWLHLIVVVAQWWFGLLVLRGGTSGAFGSVCAGGGVCVVVVR